MNTLDGGYGCTLLGKENGIAVALFPRKQRLLYAFTKNPTHESAGAGVQGASGEYSIIPAAVLNGNAGYCDFVQDGRF